MTTFEDMKDDGTVLPMTARALLPCTGRTRPVTVFADALHDMFATMSGGPRRERGR